MGGYGENGKLAEIVEYDPVADTIGLTGSSLPEAARDSSCVEDSIDHLIYCLGGRSQSPNYTDLVFVYDPDEDTFLQQSATFIQGRFSHDCVENSASNKIYCFGGSRNVVNLAEVTEYTPDLPAMGDVNGDEMIDLQDLIQTLQLSIGLDGEPVTRKADISANRQLGLEEAVYILRRNAGL